MIRSFYWHFRLLIEASTERAELVRPTTGGLGGAVSPPPPPPPQGGRGAGNFHFRHFLIGTIFGVKREIINIR